MGTNETYLQNRNKVIDTESKLMITRGIGGINWENGIDMYTMLYIKYIKRITVEHRECYSILCNELYREKSNKGEYMHMYN